MRLSTLAKDVKDLLNAAGSPLIKNVGSGDPLAVAEFFWQPTYDLEKMKHTLKVVSVPAAITSARSNRRDVETEYAVDLLVQKKLGSLDETDGMMDLVEQLIAYVLANPLTGTGNALRLCTRVDIEPIYIANHLTELMVFTSVARLYYTVRQ